MRARPGWSWFAVFLGFLPVQAAWAVACTRTTSAKVSYVVCRVDVRAENLRLFHADAAGQPYRSFEALGASLERHGEKLQFAMNAGMFHPDFRPVGLLVLDGKERSPINRGEGFGNFFVQPNGVFMIDASGARVLATYEYRSHTPAIATQSGPMLVHRGLVPQSFTFRNNSPSRVVRNGVCAPTPDSAVFVISEAKVNFATFARFFRDVLGCSEALYLDGSISSLYAPALKRADGHAALGPMFAVTR
jgi:uncharacterized protein YigE (DUF2233 family)